MRLERNMNTPQFSIATPTRNALPKLRRCVGSVRGQSGVSLEHRVQDALSSDGTQAWLQTQTKPGLFFRSEADAGMYDAINRAWQQSRGDILAWLNADEQYLPGTLEFVVRYFENHPEVDVLFGDYLVADAQGNGVAWRKEVPYRRHYVVNGFLYLASCTLFYRRRLLESGLLTLDTRYRYAADKDLILRLDAAGARIAHVPRCLSIFGIDGANLSTHSSALEENEAVRVAHGALQPRWLRPLATVGRRVERLLNGAYRPSELQYQYATDEQPHYVLKTARVGGRYTLASQAA
jgi:glycosyltransferase involved in cell wall biosynthesis